MKRFLPLIIILVFGVLHSNADVETSYYVKKDGKSGYINEKGEFVIPLKKYDWIAGRYSDGLVGVLSGRDFSFYDETGKEKLNLGRRYLFVFDFQDGLAALQTKNGLGFIDKDGSEVIKPSIRAEAARHSNGRIVTVWPPKSGNNMDGREYEVIDLSGKVIIPRGTYDYIHDFCDGVAMVFNKTTDWHRFVHGFVNHDGKIIVPLGYNLADVAREGVMLVASNQLWTAFDTNGTKLFQVEAEARGIFSDGLLRIQGKGTNLFGYIDRTGTWVIKPAYRRCGDFSHGLAMVVLGGEIKKLPGLESIPEELPKETGGKIAFIDKTGKVVISPEVVQVADEDELFPMWATCQGTLIQFTQRGKIGYMDRTGKWVWPLSN